MKRTALKIGVLWPERPFSQLPPALHVPEILTYLCVIK